MGDCGHVTEDGRMSIQEVCVWKEDNDGNYDTSCDRAFVLIAGTLEENEMRYCCYCGKRLIGVGYFEEYDE